MHLAAPLVAWTIIASALFAFSPAMAQELFHVSWPTKLASNPVALVKPASDYLPLFRIGLLTLPESQMVAMALSQPSFLGLSSQSAAELQKLTAIRYQLIQSDPVFSKAQSALPYCYAAEKPAEGFAQIYVPKNSGPGTPVLLFVHGFGGSFLWYQHLLAEVFPERIIICPAYGITPAEMPPGYLIECMEAVSKKLGYTLEKPDLAGLSAGGFGVCRIYAQSPETFARLLVLAAYPPPETIKLFDKRMTASFIAGALESYVTSGYFRTAINAIHTSGAAVQSNVIANADHFFLLSHKEETARLLRVWAEAGRLQQPVVPK